MMMPVMNGHQLIVALRKINPNVKIIASSGLIDKHLADDETGLYGFLSKPYTAEKLLHHKNSFRN
jgi:two-component system, cell cycle sensor histidine kinase and response regulator CckA